jgi:excinuclease UvrABC ATPase subunit
MPTDDFSGFVRVRGAREHNLKDVAVDVPRDALVVFSGVSGSGKSSLAFGTIYAEAQRRYFESVAPYARRLIDQVGVPDVDDISGLPPAVALQQQRGTPGSRSSVGSVTTISSLLRMLYSRAGRYPPRQPMLYAEDFSPNTAQGACPNCHGLGRVYEVTERLMVPDDSLTIRERAVAAWPPAWHGQNLRDILVSMGIDVDVPWRTLPKKTRDWILFTEEQPTVPVYPGFTPAETRTALRRKTEPAYMGTFTGARRYVLHTFATTQSPLMKRRVARFMTGAICPACDGKRLKKEALSVTFAGLDIGALAGMSLDRVAEVLAPAAAGRFDVSEGAAGLRGSAERAPAYDRTAARADTARRVAAGGSAHAGAFDVRRTPDLSEEKRIAAQRIAADVIARVETLRSLGLGYLSLDRSTPDSLARRAAAAAAGNADPLQPVRGRLRPRRADRRAASEGRRRAARGARRAEAIRQLDLRGRARPGDDAARRLDRRRRPGRRRARRPRPVQRAPRGTRTDRGVAHGPLPVRPGRAPAISPPHAAGVAGAGRNHTQQPRRARRAFPARRADRGDRRLRVGQVEPGERGARRARLPPTWP